MKNCAQYIAEAKRVLGDPRMSDRELGERLGGYIQSNISRAKSGVMTDPLAMDLASVLKVHPAEILIVARAEREKTPEVRAALIDYVGKVLSRLPEKALGAVAALGVAVGLLCQPMPAEAGLGGVGRLRHRRA